MRDASPRLPMAARQATSGKPMTDHARHIALITDSTCDIPDDLVARYGIRITPLYLIWGTEQFRDRFEITPREFYMRLASSSVHPTSSQPVAADFMALLDEARAGGAEAAVIITISSQLSGTVESARQAAAQSEMPVRVVDSKSGGMAFGWQVIAAARAREAGGDAAAMVDAADRARSTMQIIFFVDSLDYLHRGGRIGGAARLVGSALNLKPVLYVDHTVGRVEPGERIRTRRRALDRVYEVFFERMDVARPLHVAVIHSNAPDLAEALRERVVADHDPAELLLTGISPVMGTHIGPGAVGLAGYYEV
jgi:DegV family protein with EDD domain